MGVCAEDWVVGGGFGLDGKLVVSSRDEEVAFVAPSSSVRVTTYPVFLFGLWVHTPPENDNRMIQILPRNTIALQSLVTNVLRLIGLRQSVSMHLLVQLLDTSSSENTIVVHREYAWRLHLTIDGAVSHDFFHHFLL